MKTSSNKQFQFATGELISLHSANGTLSQLRELMKAMNQANRSLRKYFGIPLSVKVRCLKSHKPITIRVYA